MPTPNGAGFPKDFLNPARLTPDGRYAAFDCTEEYPATNIYNQAYNFANRSLVPNDNNHAYDVFLRDLTTNTIELISVRQPALPSQTPAGSSRRADFFRGYRAAGTSPLPAPPTAWCPISPTSIAACLCMICWAERISWSASTPTGWPTPTACHRTQASAAMAVMWCSPAAPPIWQRLSIRKKSNTVRRMSSSGIYRPGLPRWSA
jgi:hypothetical protein